MVHKCCVETCLTIKRPNIVFHRFPLSDSEKLRQWLFTLNMDLKTPRYVLGKLFVCQKHFQPDDYYDVQNLPSRRGRCNIGDHLLFTRGSQSGKEGGQKRRSS
uniref:THAP domain-containing protein 1 n=1 Tax=Oreochromis aureus TaxID=47969 RepID=A0A668TS56_OREAU